ncbi:MAG: hypothetical protein L0Z62_20565 [Gemmataceae bacterium]|nr:hypothetical protein [Gemmataceae bacterium]
MTTKTNAPVVLDLAPLPRDQIGPFLLLGLDKIAEKAQIEKNWAQRVIWARKNQIRVALEDINWAREVVNDADKRVRADSASLNIDTTDATLRRLAERYTDPEAGATCQPLDAEKPLADYTPPTPVPDPDEVRAAIAVPNVPQEAPAVLQILDKFLQEPLDPWKLDLK